MDNNLKRRTFLWSLVGILVGAPIASRFFMGSRQDRETHRFTKELNRLQTLTQVPIEPLNSLSLSALTLTPPIGKTMNYVVFAQSYLPEEVSQALGDEPDMFLAREGRIITHQTNQSQTVLTGGDTNFVICSPLSTEERQKNAISLLVKDQKWNLAKPKDKPLANIDRQFLHLLSLSGMPKEWAIGKKWKSNTGRIKPFQNCPTDYEVAGFAEVAGRKTIQIRFNGSIPNVAKLSGVNAQKPDKEMTMTNTHKGNAWFDLETGFLVRQEQEMTTKGTGIPGYTAKNGSKEFIVKANTIIQLGYV